MNFANIFFAGISEVISFNDCPIDMFSPTFSHFLFILDPKELTYKLRVNSDYFNDFVPQLENLRTD
jgi:hypothetical protein